jgi:hypothetical protein
VITVESATTHRGWDCDVEIIEGERRSRHNVRVSRDDLARWGGPGAEDPDALVKRAFEFLLRREPAEQILKSFALRDVTRYFPEFDEEMAPR